MATKSRLRIGRSSSVQFHEALHTNDFSPLGLHNLDGLRSRIHSPIYKPGLGNMSMPYFSEGLCPLCRSLMREPRFLPCLHCVCVLCLNALLTGTFLQCPVCNLNIDLNLPIEHLLDTPFEYVTTNDFPCSQMSRLSLNNISEFISTNFPGINKCFSCTEHKNATAQCRDCNEFLCDACLAAHLRVRVTRNHSVIKLNSNNEKCNTVALLDEALSQVIVSSNHNSPLLQESAGQFCSLHKHEILKLYCTSCKDILCDKCSVADHSSHKLVTLLEAADESRLVLPELMSEVHSRIKGLKNHTVLTHKTGKSFSERFDAVVGSIQGMTSRHKALLDKREERFLNKMKLIREVKSLSLYNQMKDTGYLLSRLSRGVEYAGISLKSCSYVDMVRAKDKLINYLLEVQQNFSPVMPQESDYVGLKFPNEQIIENACNMGFITSSAYGGNCGARGRGLHVAVRNVAARFIVFCYDHIGDRRYEGGDEIKAIIQGPGGKQARVIVKDNNDGTYLVSYIAPSEGTYEIKILVNTVEIIGSPVKVKCRPSRAKVFKNGKIRHPVMVFGSNGINEGQFSRPWGIACNKDGYLAIGDRSNNRIQVFSPTGKFCHCFGQPGSGDGQFDKPAGLAFDFLNRIVAVDKDNHRVQVFSIDGKFIFKFGGQGIRGGQFLYPWDVACNYEGLMVVSDARNHRVQFFNYDGRYLGQFASDNPGNFLDAPRGICFNNRNEVLVTDFNNHRILVISKHSGNFRSIQGDDCHANYMVRPQSVTVDDEGYVIVTDSRNPGVLVFDDRGTFICRFGGSGSGPGQMSSPCGVCVTPAGMIVLVDSGNDRIQVF